MRTKFSLRKLLCAFVLASFMIVPTFAGNGIVKVSPVSGSKMAMVHVYNPGFTTLVVKNKKGEINYEKFVNEKVVQAIMLDFQLFSKGEYSIEVIQSGSVLDQKSVKVTKEGIIVDYFDEMKNLPKIVSENGVIKVTYSNDLKKEFEVEITSGNYLLYQRGYNNMNEYSKSFNVSNFINKNVLVSIKSSNQTFSKQLVIK